jgi:hypothetical protein
MLHVTPKPKDATKAIVSSVGKVMMTNERRMEVIDEG